MTSNLSNLNVDAANRFIEWVKSGTTPPITEPLTPEIASAVRVKMNGLDDANKQKINAALDALKPTIRPVESQENSIASLFEWTHSDLMKQSPKIANEVMEDALKSWKWPSLNPEQKENIKLAIIDRVASGAFAQAMLWGVQRKLQSVTDKFSKIDAGNISNISQLDDIAKEFSLDDTTKTAGWKSKTMEEKITEQVVKMMQEWLWDIQKAHEWVPQPVWYTLLLAHPKALSSYQYGMDIPTLLQASGDAQGTKDAFKIDIKVKIQKLESQIIGMEQSKEKIFDTIARVPEFASNWLFEMMEWIFKIPIFGKFAAAFLGFDDPKTAIDELKMETKQRKSVHMFVSFGIIKNDKWEIVKGDNSGKISILKDIDFTGVDFAKLKPFMKKMKESGIDVSHADFWKSVFVDGKIETWEWDKKKLINFSWWEEWKETADTIVRKLNTGTQLQVVAAPPIAPPASPVAIISTPVSSTSAPPVTTWVNLSNLVIAWGAWVVPWVSPLAWATAPRTQVDAISQTREQALIATFNQAQSIPFDFTYGDKTETVKFDKNQLMVWSMAFEIKWQKKIWVMLPLWGQVFTNITLDNQKINLIYGTKPEEVVVLDKALIEKNIPMILAYQKNTENPPIKEKNDSEEQLLIKRVT